ncbi:hypothetical protein FGRMN_10390 [Fusarium graminum]|nr:hypothetical protein FGRMN_10390 [Fusarium graminum]
MFSQPKCRRDFHIGIICALPFEYNAMSLVVDQFWDGAQAEKAGRDPNTYSFGRIGDWDVVFVHLSSTGKVSAAIAAANLRMSFPNLELVLLTGVCGGVSTTPSGEEISLGDVVISSSIVEHDIGAPFSDGFADRNNFLDRVGKPPKNILNFVTLLGTDRGREMLEDKAAVHLAELQSRTPTAGQERLGQQLPQGDNILGNTSGLRAQSPLVFVGCVGSGQNPMSAEQRDGLAKAYNIIAFEREAVGAWDEVPCIIVKGVCDYADGLQNAEWQATAATTAAAFSKALIQRYPRSDRIDTDDQLFVGGKILNADAGGFAATR